jgi:hypothetical protein
MDSNHIEEDGEDSILTFDLSDDALERAAGTDAQVATFVYCTHFWYYCDLPQ